MSLLTQPAAISQDISAPLKKAQRYVALDAYRGLAPVAQATAVLFAMWYLCYWLYRRQIFLKL